MLWNGKEVSRMPGFDGTGPKRLGPMTGRGEGYCTVVLPSSGMARAPFDPSMGLRTGDTQGRPYGYAGLAGVPFRMDYPYGRSLAYGPVSPVAAAPYAPFFRRPHWGMRFVRGRGRGRGRRRW
jgi:hypothetical protein